VRRKDGDRGDRLKMNCTDPEGQLPYLKATSGV